MGLLGWLCKMNKQNYLNSIDQKKEGNLLQINQKVLYKN